MLKRYNILSFIIIIVTMVSGCATQGINTEQHVDSPVIKITNEITVNKPYSQVWDGLVKQLSKSFYVINNIDKESRIINISFISDKPTDFIDCGKTHRTYAQGDKIEQYDYETAGKANFKMATPQKLNNYWAGFILAQRDTSIDGRANIYVAPDERNPATTTVTVNARYILTIKSRADVYGQHANGNVIFVRNVPQNDVTISLNTNKPETHVFRDGSVVCFSKGTLENEILSMVKQ